MRRCVPLVVLFVLSAGSAMAQVPESTTQMGLAKSTRFTDRLQYLMVQQSRTVLSEAQPAQCATERKAYAKSVIQDPAPSAAQAAVMIVGGINLIGTRTGTGTEADPYDSSASDAAILSQIATFWNAISKCATTP